MDLLALVAARQLGLEADGDEQAHYRATFMDERSLATENDLARFWSENDLTEAEGERLLHDRATLEKAVEWLRLSRFKLGVVRPLLDTYRHQGEYSGWADAAAATQKHHGRGEDGLPPRVALPPLSTAEQIARHSRESGWPVPRDLLQWSQKHGFQHPKAVLMEIERSRLARDQGGATRPSASGGGDGEERTITPAPSIRQRPGIESQVGADAVGAGEAAEGHGVEALAGKAGITHAIEAAHARAVERHRQQAG